ncbi:MAG: hypothetical protein Q4E83_08140 [bacterium]|nr:hypothetical protein [bacterium]
MQISSQQNSVASFKGLNLFKNNTRHIEPKLMEKYKNYMLNNLDIFGTEAETYVTIGEIKKIMLNDLESMKKIKPKERVDIINNVLLKGREWLSSIIATFNNGEFYDIRKDCERIFEAATLKAEIDNKIKKLSNVSIKLGGKDKKKYDNLISTRSAIEEGQLNLVKSLKENIQHNIESAKRNNIEKEATAWLNLNMFEKMDANRKFFGIK